MAGIHIVKKKLRYPEQVIKTKFQDLKKETNNEPTVDQLKQFYDENFADDPYEAWTPPDLKETPSLVDQVDDEAYREWVLKLNQIWKALGQRVPEDVRVNPDRHSTLYVPNGFIMVHTVKVKVRLQSRFRF
jgi:alpha,alpha-trehalase